MGGGMLAGVRVHLAGAAVLVAATGCSTDGDSTTTATNLYRRSLPPVALRVTRRSAGSATTAANALATGNAPALFELSRMDSIDCAEVTREYFPQCGSRDVIEGHGLSDAGFIVELVAGDTYRDRLEEITSGVDPAYADQLGGGAVHVLGVGTCGPDVPGRRTYHLAWTAALAEGDELGTARPGQLRVHVRAGLAHRPDVHRRAGRWKPNSPTRSRRRSAQPAEPRGRERIHARKSPESQ